MLCAEQIAEEFGIKVAGEPGAVIHRASSLQDAKPGSLTWLKPAGSHEELAKGAFHDVVILLKAPGDPKEERLFAELAKHNTLLLVDPDRNPRLVFARILARYFSHEEVQIPFGVSSRAVVESSAMIGRNVTIADFCFIGSDVEIGDGTILHPGVIVHSRSIIGRNCIINAHAVIGNRGFGFVRDEDGSLVHFPHLGNVVIEDNVEIQANTVVDRTALGETRIGEGTKIDNLCHIGHGAQIGPHCIITACSEIGAQVVIEEGAWIGPNSCSIEGITIGKGSFVGIGSTVTKSIPPDTVVAGSPAEPIDEFKNFRKALKMLVRQSRLH